MCIRDRDYYGHGTMFFPGEDAMWLGHTGRIAGGSSIVLLHPEHNLSIAILTNAKGWNGYVRAIETIEQLFLDAYSRS